jgi:hypothetical protein
MEKITKIEVDQENELKGEIDIIVKKEDPRDIDLTNDAIEVTTEIIEEEKTIEEWTKEDVEIKEIADQIGVNVPEVKKKDADIDLIRETEFLHVNYVVTRGCKKEVIRG